MNVLIASPNKQLKLALAFLLNTESNIRCTSSISTCVELLTLAPVSTPDVILLDGALSEVLPRLSALRLKAKLIIISDEEQFSPNHSANLVLNPNDLAKRLLPCLY